MPKSLSDKVRKHQRLSKQDYQTFMTILNDKGWLATHWPTEYGGTGWNAIEKHIFEQCVWERCFGNNERKIIVLFPGKIEHFKQARCRRHFFFS